ncbi:MAG: TIM barrel protein [Saprospiraceae bacterium]|nr:TIM barrel protein [Saprospiraceae bacterium]
MLNRRSLLKHGTLAALAAVSCTPRIQEEAQKPEAVAAHVPFRLKFAPHLGMFAHHAGEDPIDQINFMADQGFHAFEDNNLKRRPPEVQQAIGKTLVDRQMTMGVFVGGRVRGDGPTIVTNDPGIREQFLADIRESIVAAKRVNATWMTTIPGRLDLRQHIGFQTANVIETLKQAAALLEPHGLVMVLEPLNFYNHPGFFLSEIPQTYQICKAVDSPSCKILFDIYHQQIQEGNLIPNIDDAWDEIAYFQIGDNPGRKEPTTGEINYKNVFQHIHDKGYRGVLGMEHGNFHDGKEGEEALIQAYRAVDLAAST